MHNDEPKKNARVSVVNSRTRRRLPGPGCGISELRGGLTTPRGGEDGLEVLGDQVAPAPSDGGGAVAPSKYESVGGGVDVLIIRRRNYQPKSLTRLEPDGQTSGPLSVPTI